MSMRVTEGNTKSQGKKCKYFLLKKNYFGVCNTGGGLIARNILKNKDQI